ncbi:MAG: AI-2E family transporter [Pseudomonadota bacterium]
MGLSAKEQVRYWGIAAAALLAFFWLMGNTLLPFIVGAAIAYLLDPVADWFEAHGFTRVAATALITLAVIVSFGVLILVIQPLIWSQITVLGERAPNWPASIRTFIENNYPELFDENSTVRRALAGMEDTLKNSGIAMVQAVLSSSLAVLDFILVIVLSPVIAFYLLMDWDRLVAWIDDLIPREHVAVTRKLAVQVDEVLSGFVRGQLTVAAMLGGFYALALSVIGLPFGILIGIFAGLVSFIPFVGSITGGVLSIGVATFHFWGDWTMIALVAAVFLTGQAVEGNVLTPYLVGDKVKLHPVWLIFALSAFGALMGLAGMLIAVPLAAVAGVLGRFGVTQYKDGRLYQGPEATRSKDAAE